MTICIYQNSSHRNGEILLYISHINKTEFKKEDHYGEDDGAEATCGSVALG